MAKPTRTSWTRQTSQTVALPPVVNLSTIPDGSWMVAVMLVGADIQPAAHPAGWRNPLPTLSQRSGTRRMAIGFKVKSGDTSLSWTTVANANISLFVMWGGGPNPDTTTWKVGMIGVRDVNSLVTDQSIVAGDSTHSVAPTVNVTATDSLVLSVLMEATTATGTFTVTSGATSWFDSPEQATFIESLATGYTEPSTGATGAVTATATATQANNGMGVQIVIPPAGDVPPPTPNPGFHSAGQLIATPGATWAHRGGSTNWPEMSQYAYEQSALRNYGALEFSAQRSSNGWWFGLHDNNFDRTSQVSGSPAPSTLTQAQILATYQNSLNSAGTPRPYWGLIEFLDTWTPTHVVIVDPKNQLAHTAEFISLLKAHGGPSKIIVKYSGIGAGSAALADAARAEGFETWGYFYEGDVADGDLAAWQSHWSILGMEYLAAQSAWDAILSYGKPVVGHIAQNQTSYNTAISKGADMVQCANVANITGVNRLSPENQPWDGLRVGTGRGSRVHVGAERIWP